MNLIKSAIALLIMALVATMAAASDRDKWPSHRQPGTAPGLRDPRPLQDC